MKPFAMSTGTKFDASEIGTSSAATGELARTSYWQPPGRTTARLYAISPKTTPPQTKLVITGRWHQMSELTLGARAKDMITENGAAFLLGWLLGAGLGPALWDSITGVL